MAKTLDELPVYQKTLELSALVTAILERPVLIRNCKLRDQIGAAMESVLSNLAEGFEQPTDAGLVNYLFMAKGSAAEVRTRIQSAERRRFVTPDDCARCADLAITIEKMLGGWIKYLARCGWRDRGRRGLTPTQRSRG